MITAFEAENLKGLRRVRTALGAFTALVGPNGVGKSTLLDGIHWALQLTGYPRDTSYTLGAAGQIFQGPRSLDQVLSKPDARTMHLAVEVDGAGAFTAGLQADEKRALCKVSLTRMDGQFITYPKTMEAERAFFDHETMRGLSSVVRLRLDAEHLGRPSAAATARPSIRFDGQNLPTMLQYLAGERDGRLERIEADVAQVVPGFRRVHTPPTTVEEQSTELVRIGNDALNRVVTNKVPAHRLEVEFEGIGRVPAEHVSEGTLLALGLLTFLHAEPPRMVLIDDGERALHPEGQQRFVALIKTLLAERPALQVVMTTHSPDLVDACTPDEVRVFGRGEDGAVHIAPLTEHPDAARWMHRMRVGEFWSTVGEQWVASVPVHGSNSDPR